MIQNRKVVLVQMMGAGFAGEPCRYRVVELHNTVDLDIGQKLFKKDVEALMRAPKLTVVVKGEVRK